MDLCLHAPSHMCPLTSLCLCYTRLRISEPLLKEIVQLSPMSCLIYCLGLVTTVFLVLVLVSIAEL